MCRFIYRNFLILIALLFCSTAMAERTDLVFLYNGDRVTGEVKGLKRGKLELKTDHMGTLFIEWSEISQIVSDTGQMIELVDGQNFYGTLEKSAKDNMLAISTEQGTVDVDALDIIFMQPVEGEVWDRLDFSASLGFSWDKASDVGKYNLGADAVYRQRASIVLASFSTELTTQQNQGDTSRSVFNAAKLIFMPNKRYRAYFGNMEQNDELSISLRTLIGASYGWIPVRSQQSWLTMGGGMVINHEIPQDGDTETNLEAAAMLHYEFYRYSSPERSLNVDLKLYPSLTDFGRLRTNFDTNFKLEFMPDLFWKLQFYASYDNAPISKNASGSDYGIISSLGYKF